MCNFYYDLQENHSPESHLVMALALYMLHRAKFGTDESLTHLIEASLSGVISGATQFAVKDVENAYTAHITMRNLKKDAAGYQQLNSDLLDYTAMAKVMVLDMKYRATCIQEHLDNDITTSEISVTSYEDTSSRFSFCGVFNSLLARKETLSPSMYVHLVLPILHLETLRAVLDKSPLHRDCFKREVRKGYQTLRSKRLELGDFYGAAPAHIQDKCPAPELISCNTLCHTLEGLGISNKIVFPFRPEFFERIN